MAHIQYINDSQVDDTLDAELRKLLSTCFTKPQDYVFQERRYFKEPPAHRWVIRFNENAELAAHVAVHEKTVQAGDVYLLIGGIAEVCVHPGARGMGYAKQLLSAAHCWMEEQGFAFSVLSGNPQYYASSGYVSVDNFFQTVSAPDGVKERDRVEGAMVLALSQDEWPAGEVTLPGPMF